MDLADLGTNVFRRAESRFGFSMRVLIYHRVAESSIDALGMTVSPACFDEQVAVLAAAGRVVALDEELCGGHAKRPRRRVRTFAITFDDGYVDNLWTALPLLERHDAPATIFIASAYIDQPYFWWDRLAEIIFGAANDPAEVAATAGRVGVLGPESVDSLAEESAGTVYKGLYGALAARDVDERVRVLDEVGCALSFAAPAESPRPLTSDELLQLASHQLITIGTHTHSHPRLTSTSPVEALGEIVDGGRRLDELLGPGRRLFAYPHGDANGAVARLVRKAGYHFAFTTVSRPVSLIDSSLLLPRIATSDVDGREFARLRGLGDARVHSS